MFRDRILQLQHSFPEDFLDKDGHRFWTGSKRYPRAGVLDVFEPQHMEFLIAAANLLAVNFGIQVPIVLAGVFAAVDPFYFLHLHLRSGCL